MKLYKYIDGLLNSYTPQSPAEQTELLGDRWYQDAQAAYEDRFDNATESDADFRQNIESLKAKYPTMR